MKLMLDLVRRHKQAAEGQATGPAVGIPSVCSAHPVVIAATLTQFGLPLEGIALLLGVDTFLDMGRTATNVVGNAVATSVITKWEGMLQPPLDPDAEPPHAPAHTVADGRAGLNLDPANYEK